MSDNRTSPVGELVDVAGGYFRIEAATDLERYRAETILTKEPETITWIDRFDEGAVLFDVGANIGIYSLYAAATRGVRVFAFEPYYKNFHHLTANVVANGLVDVVPLAVALGAKTGVDILEVPDTRFGASGSQLGQAVDDNGQAFEPRERVGVAAFSMDDAIDALGLPAPTYVKIDVDGLELTVLVGMERTLANPALRSVLLEVNTHHISTDDVDAVFSGNGFVRDATLNDALDHSRQRRQAKGSGAENIVYSRP